MRVCSRSLICCVASSASFSRVASSSRGAIQTTFPVRRLSRPRACRMMSSAWSQGTSFRRRVMFPVTVSLVMMLRSVKSAITLSTARTSTFWKLSESFSPV